MDSSSKVTVEYHDPSGVFPLILRDIQSRLPLRNLNWRSLNRPLRQIKSLHLDFVPDSSTRRALQLPVPQNSSERATSLDVVGNGIQHQKNAVRARQHQIPGLQTSPYLKIYVVRCDDKAKYKETERIQVREWIKQATASRTKGNHDAFEWLILHVVVPDTLAASEPRWREAASEDSEDLKERKKQGAKWPGKSTRTVFDKLRADFNESGKSGQDRVAQIRLPKDQFPVDLLPTPAAAATLKETPEEREKAWIDLITKTRTLILDTFDKRVKQYEADIVEQESRRSLPGFNFCTFFIYKEGLAKALESIGLIEDALVIYDELAIGLETVLRDRASGRAEGTATLFAPYTLDIKERITQVEKPLPNGVDSNYHTPNASADSTEDGYRERIVRSSVSIFDFFSYLFSRQKNIILRLANAKAARIQLGLSPKGGSEDLVLISEVCWRAASFIHNNARLLRQDLSAYKDHDATPELSAADIESLLSSWIYDAAGKVLEETASFALDYLPEPGQRDGLVNDQANSPNSRGGLGAISAHPQRSSSLRTASLPPKKTRLAELQNRNSLQSASENDLMNRPLSAGADEAGAATRAQPGFAELVTYRASLVMMQRKALEVLAKQRGWLAGWASIKEKPHSHRMSEVQLDNHQVNGDVAEEEQSYSTALSPALSSALSTRFDFYKCYERLSEQAIRYYIASTQAKSVETIIGDLAILKYQQGDYGYAVRFFQHALPLYREDGWSLMELEALKMHAKCLKELGRKEDCVKISLLLVANACARKKEEAETPRSKFHVGDEAAESATSLSQLVEVSREMDTELVSPAAQFFSDIRFDREIQHPSDQDGLAISLHLRHLLDEDLELDHVRVRLVCAEDENQEILLVSCGALTLTPGTNRIELRSHTLAFGAYRVERIILEAGNLLFEHDFRPKPDSGIMGLEADNRDVDGSDSPSGSDQPLLFLYPAQNAFNVEVSLTPDIQLDSMRSLVINLSSGRNDVHSIDLRLKPATAGLRLFLSDAKLNAIGAPEEKEEEEANTEPGHLALGPLAPTNKALIQLPYSLEQAGQQITIRLEAHYHTTQGSFVFAASYKLDTQLPLDVNVHDNFQYDALFSSFTVRTTAASPLCVSYVKLEPSARYDVLGPPAMSVPMPVFEAQPVRLLYKITQREATGESEQAGEMKKAALALKVSYHLVDEALLTALLGRFGEAVESSPFAKLTRMLVFVLDVASKDFWSPADAQMALLLNETRIPSFAEVGWDEVMPAVPLDTRAGLRTWLQQWHADNVSLSFRSDTASVGCLRSILISVDIPHVDVVHKASLTLVTTDKHLPSHPQILTLGEPIRARLRVSSTKCWADQAKARDAAGRETETAMNFVYELHAEADAWLIGGQRRGHFTVHAEGEHEVECELVLVPLKVDLLSLPQVDVQPEPAAGGGVEGLLSPCHSTNKHNDGPSVTSEMHYESAGEVVQIIRSVTATRIHIPESSGAAVEGREVMRNVMVSRVKDAG